MRRTPDIRRVPECAGVLILTAMVISVWILDMLTAV